MKHLEHGYDMGDVVMTWEKHGYYVSEYHYQHLRPYSGQELSHSFQSGDDYDGKKEEIENRKP